MVPTATVLPSTYAVPATYALGHPTPLHAGDVGASVVGLSVVGAIVPLHDPLSVQASSQAVPVPGMYPARGHQLLAGPVLH